jgi:hypothetical protein
MQEGTFSTDAYRRLFAASMPDTATTAHHLSAIITLVQTAKVALRNDEQENDRRADVALKANGAYLR